MWNLYTVKGVALEFTDSLCELLSHADGIALAEEYNAVERVADNHDGAFGALRQAATKEIVGHLLFAVDAKAEIFRQVRKFAATFHEGVVLCCRGEEHQDGASPAFKFGPTGFNIVENMGARLIVGFE